MEMKRKKGYYSISAVAQMFSVHQQTIRLYEKEGLISPKRSEGNTRLFSEEDVQRLEEVIYLTHKLGINLAGVEMILKLQKQIKKLQTQVNDMFKQAQEELQKEAEDAHAAIKEAAQGLNAMQGRLKKLKGEE
jgi:MerR family transcriptional regulator/heat shock protein HspR